MMVLTLSSLVRQSVVGVCLVLVLALTFCVYEPGLTGKFAFDDGPNIAHNNAIAVRHLDLVSLKKVAFSGASGILKRPISMLTFGLNYYFSGWLNPFAFKLTNVIIHLLNGVALYVLTMLILNSCQSKCGTSLTQSHMRWISLAVISAWLLHPLNLTAVLYVVQRMTSLSALFTFGGLIAYMLGRQRLLVGQPGGVLRIACSVLVFLPLAMLSKENGALMAPLILVLELLLFQFEAINANDKKFLKVFFGLFVAGVAIVLIYVFGHMESFFGGYRIRDFSLTERLMTEARVMWFYVGMIIFPKTEQMGLFHDDIAVSYGLFAPLTTLLSIAGLLLLLVIAYYARRKHPIVALGILFFLVGHTLESTVLPLEITFEHRNYLPMYGVLLIIFYYVLYPLAYLKSLFFRRIAAPIFIGLLAFSTATRAEQWGNLFLLNMTEVAHHPDSYRANAEMGATYGLLAISNAADSEQNFQQAYKYFEKSSRLNPRSTDGLFGLLYYASILNKPIDPEWVNELAHRLLHEPFAGNIGDTLFNLVTCQEKRQCKLSNQNIRELLDAASQNPTLNGLSKAAVMTAVSLHLANIEKDTQGAVDAAYSAARALPNEPGYRANLIELLIAMNRVDEARKEIMEARQMDTMGTHTHIFDREEFVLNSALIKKSGQGNN